MSDFTHNAGMIGSGITLSTSVMTWLGDNATAIGAMVAVSSFILTATFMILNYRLNLKRLEFDRRNSQKADQ